MGSVRRVATQFGLSIADLGLGSIMLWLRLFPQLTTIWLAGWLVTELCTRITTTIPVQYVWFSMVVFAIGFLGTLGAIVLMLRLVAHHLDLAGLVPDADEEHSITHLLSITLLPFLGIYAAVNEIAARADQLEALTVLQTGLLAEHTIFSELNPFTSPQRLAFVIVLVISIYILRRVVDLLHERTGKRWLGVAGTVLEGYFLLVLLLSGRGLFANLDNWWRDRQVVQWLDDAGSAIAGFFGLFSIDWPIVVRWAWEMLTQTLWPLVIEGMVQPVIWLAVAALVYGSRALSLADLWRQGAPLSAQVPVPRRIRRLQAVRQEVGSSRSARRFWLEVQELFLNDLNDKYLPTFQSLRLVMRAGAIFLGSYVLLYAVWEVMSQVWEFAVVAMFGGHDSMTWLQIGTYADLLIQAPLEPLRICLLALAFHRCYAVFYDRAAALGRSGKPIVRAGVAE